MRVLSLFDGISCGRVALERAGIPVEKYFASEIDRHAVKISLRNYPDIIHLGNVSNIDFTRFRGRVDMVIGGSPCQGFSFAGKQLNFKDPRSKLFFEFVRAIREIQPKYFLLENVKMKKEFIDVISEYLGVQPIEINSALVSAQNRKRLYWTNIPNVSQPADKGILLKDIIHEFTDCQQAGAISVLYDRRGGLSAEKNKAVSLCASDWRGLNRNQAQNAVLGLSQAAIPEYLKNYIVPMDSTLKILDKEVAKGKIGYFGNDCQANRIYTINGKAVCLLGEAGGGAAKMGQYLVGVIEREHGYRTGGIKAKEKMPTITANGSEKNNHLLFGCMTPDRIIKEQNGRRFNDGIKFYTLTASDKHGVLVNGYIRKLTPVECERLQTLPDKYTACVSDSQRYKALGNGWTVDVIAHIFKGIKQ